MYYVYILQSLNSGKIYTGFTKDLQIRVAKHKYGNVHTTKRFGEIELIFYEAFKSEKDARRREIYLKSTKGKRALKIMLQYSRNKAPSSNGSGR